MISKDDVFKEIISPQKFDEILKSAEDFKEVLSLVYKLGYMNLRISLDARSNIVRMSQGEKLQFKNRPQQKPKQDNPVIKETDEVGD